MYSVTILDSIKTEYNTLFVKLKGYDSNGEGPFEGEIKFIGGRPFGDLLHHKRSTLSPDCREYVIDKLMSKYIREEF